MRLLNCFCVPVIIVIFSICQVKGRPNFESKDDHLMHFIPKSHIRKRSIENEAPVEKTTDYWRTNGQLAVNERITRKPNKNIAKNVILFLGDGMSIPTISAARMYMGNENKKLPFDEFPHTGLSMTYCVDSQVADSACSATAYLGGVKANIGTLGVNAKVKKGDCLGMTNSSNFVDSIAQWSQKKGKKTGLVTTARVTHASPAGLYAHSSHRDWEADSNVYESEEDPNICHDIAYQLVNNAPGNNLNVILGGGRAQFLPNETIDEEGVNGNRTDGVNLIQQWLGDKVMVGDKAQYVWNKQQLQGIVPDTDYVLGLFSDDHMPFNLERNATLTPSLEEMTETAIRLLDNTEEGYFLFVEGARIDMGHHQTQARKALDETAEFAKAIKKAMDLTDVEDTLIVVTSDHAHTMSYSGYPERGNDILGYAGQDMDGYLYTTLNYANGLGYNIMDDSGNRHDFAKDDLTDINYRYPVIYPMAYETHGGDDVGIFARGPWSHLFTGVMEENVIPHLMAFASCVSNGITACDSLKEAH
ncbi:unnamed protein product [Brassicogethes aeneus]|uniref:Alkaline phosphatase n=1 Tax=Brassicogethes aeneus TaxID=1431903 RepID=A0A9P0FN49_BRAAE|nr:unnamed protein product [Brassicogethes aeneus]